ncbi:MAG: alpha/beta hydrolase [Solirubrobacteraceae bacterium]|nr:alpha/beta hydrolase [Solirubrobacteraceae bacterium]
MRSPPIAVAAASALLLATTASAAADPSVTRDVPYARAPTGETLTADVYLPSADRRTRPVLILAHGGGWTQGNKGNMETVARAYLRYGFAVASIQYRLAPSADGLLADDPRAAMDASQQDMEAAVRAVRASAARFGFDGRRVFVSGESAGAWTALRLATETPRPFTANAQFSSAPTGVVSVVGSACVPLVTSQVNSTTVPLRDGTSVTRTADLRGCTAQFHRGGPPMMLFNGLSDPIVPWLLGVSTCQLAQASGQRCTMIPVLDGHYMMSSQTSREFVVGSAASWMNGVASVSPLA